MPIESCAGLAGRWCRGRSVNNIVTAWAIVRQTRNAYVMQAALRKHRLAKQAAIQHVIDKQNEKVEA